MCVLMCNVCTCAWYHSDCGVLLALVHEAEVGLREILLHNDYSERNTKTKVKSGTLIPSLSEVCPCSRPIRLGTLCRRTTYTDTTGDPLSSYDLY